MVQAIWCVIHVFRLCAEPDAPLVVQVPTDKPKESLAMVQRWLTGQNL